MAVAAQNPQRRRPYPRPSTASAERLREHGVRRVWLWGRGVDTERFDPARRSAQLRQELAPDGELLAGYVGRLAPEKRVDLLWQVAAMPGVRLVVVGGGPAEAALHRALPGLLGHYAAVHGRSWRSIPLDVPVGISR